MTYDEIAEALDTTPDEAAALCAELGILNPAYVTDQDLDVMCDLLDEEDDEWEEENCEDEEDDDEDLDEDDDLADDDSDDE